MRNSRRNIPRLALLAVIGLCVALAGCSRAPSVGGSRTSKAEQARKDAETMALEGVMGGAEAQVKFVPDAARAKLRDGSTTMVRAAPAPKSTPRPGSPPVVRERIASSIPYPSEAEAEEDALLQASAIVEQKLAELDPPVHHKPSLNEVKAEYIRKESRTVRPPDAQEKAILAEYNVAENRVYVEYDVEISADQVRELRSRDRVSYAIRVLGMLVAVVLAGFLFLRADEWTKGYLTNWLALGAVAAAGGVAAALIFI